MKDYMLDYIKNEENQKLINKIFISTIFIIFSFQLLRGALYFLPDKVLFFFSSNVFENFICLTSAFILYYKVFNKEHIWIKVFALGIVMSIFYAIAMLKMFRRNLNFDKSPFDDFTSYIGLAFIFIALFYFFDNLSLFVNNSYLKVRKALIETEQQLLRQRFNPHFLYNAFNSIYSMSLNNNPKTSESILKLSSMMRYLTDKSNSQLSFVKNEIKFIQDYIAMEKIRFGSEANITFDYKNLPQDILLEPLLLIPLVENAFKHGFYTNDPGNFIRIQTKVKNNIFYFNVDNKINEKQHFQKKEREGKGLKNLRKRLDLNYNNKYSLISKNDNNQFSIKLKIELNGKA